MATSTVTYSFNTTINRSVQIGDVLYYAAVGVGGIFFGSGANISIDTKPVDTVSDYNKIKRAGVITSITRTASGGSIIIEQDVLVSLPADGDFIFFSKEASVNNSSMLGYFAEVKLENDSNKKIELFNIATDVFESSK
tara:strand:+ start:236 stop:649 length:414 start_codon:yes stop_codon:yes gene_type:complete